MQIWGSHAAQNELLFRGYRWITPPVPATATRPLQKQIVTVQETPWHPAPAVRGPAQFGAVAAVLPQQQQLITRQEQPWHPTPAPQLTLPVPASAVLPLQSASYITRQEWPWHPLPWLIRPVPATAALPLQSAFFATKQEWPWHPLPTLTPSRLPPAAAAGTFVVPPQVITVQEWPRDWTGYQQLTKPVPATAALPLAPAIFTQQEWPRDWTGYRWLTPSVPQAVAPPSIALFVPQEWPRDWVGYRQLTPPVPASAALPLAPALFVRQEQPWHPGPALFKSFIPAAVTQPFVVVAQIALKQEWPGWHPVPIIWVSYNFNPPSPFGPEQQTWGGPIDQPLYNVLKSAITHHA